MRTNPLQNYKISIKHGNKILDTQKSNKTLEIV